MIRAADPTTQLVQLRQPKSFRAFYHHHGRVRKIHSHLDDCCGYQNIQFALREFFYHVIFVRLL